MGLRFRESLEGMPQGATEDQLEMVDSAWTTTIEGFANWVRKFSLFQYPFVTACCGMEFMAANAPQHDIARYGCEVPRFTPRQSDLLMVVGTSQP
jgi:NADH:ubiquinone oxidoreductase subunit B-like Fe-S oxidoreductase